MTYWIFLLLAGAMEVMGVVCIKQILKGRMIFILIDVVCFTLSFGFMSYAMQGISMGVAYAIWTGIGAAGGVIVGIVFFGESKNAIKLLCVSVIIASSMGLKYLG